MTTESLPPENSITGDANVAATSRMMWMDSDSRACSSVSGGSSWLVLMNPPSG
jgi:hypothetical protein